MTNGTKMEKLAILIGAAPIGEEGLLLKQLLGRDNIYVIAVDGGIDYLLSNCIVPDYIIGDMDSASKEARSMLESYDHQIFNPVKDDTDMALAVKRATDVGCKRLVIFGGLGGSRISHTLSNVQLLTRCAKAGIDVRAFGDGSELIMLANGSIELEPRQEGYISILSMTDVSKDVSIKGLIYEYEGDLTNDYALGQSNEYKGTKASISVGDGVILIIRKPLAVELHNL